MANRPSSKRLDYPWIAAYRAAFEPNDALLEKRITAAQEAMISSGSDSAGPHEGSPPRPPYA